MAVAAKEGKKGFHENNKARRSDLDGHDDSARRRRSVGKRLQS
jgi:hypothetical protein